MIHFREVATTFALPYWMCHSLAHILDNREEKRKQPKWQHPPWLLCSMIMEKSEKEYPSWQHKACGDSVDSSQVEEVGSQRRWRDLLLWPRPQKAASASRGDKKTSSGLSSGHHHHHAACWMFKGPFATLSASRDGSLSWDSFPWSTHCPELSVLGVPNLPKSTAQMHKWICQIHPQNRGCSLDSWVHKIQVHTGWSWESCCCLLPLLLSRPTSPYPFKSTSPLNFLLISTPPGQPKILPYLTESNVQFCAKFLLKIGVAH